MNLFSLLHLGFDNHFVLGALVVVDIFLNDVAKQSLAFFPLLLFDIQLVLKGLRIDNVGQNCQFLVHI
jgi:hypothetical protein